MKTFVETDTTNEFLNPTRTEENGIVDHIDITGLTAETQYFTRAGVIDDQGNIIYSENTENFITTAAGPDYNEPFWVKNISNSTQNLYISCSNSDTWSQSMSPQYKRGLSGSWTSFGTLNARHPILNITINADEVIYLRCNSARWYYSGGDGVHSVSINVSDNYEVGGNILSLLYGSSFDGQTVFPSGTNNYVFSHLFNTTSQESLNNNIVSAEKLLIPCADLLRSYERMFDDCTHLTTPPSLPATTLAQYCYAYMFDGCTSLTQAPELPATTLVNYCYYFMFNGCTSLTQAPELPATTLAIHCYSNMFQGCTSLTTPPLLSATNLETYCYYGMFKGCTSLTQAPELPATTLTQQCYREMFSGCTALNKVVTYAQDISASGCLTNWLNDVAALGDFYNLGGATYSTGTSGIPTGWTEHTSL